jgi:uncharacterized protein YjbI with pentapeptide repeats
MANVEHLDAMRKGANAWNLWRQEYPEILPDLSSADLQDQDLRGFNLARTNLARAQLRGAKLDAASLQRAVLWKADLAEATLTDADLSEANLRKANLFHAMLTGAKLQRANLTGALLVDTHLHRADLTGCFVYGCSVWDVLGLEEATQSGLVLLDVHSSSREWDPSVFMQPALTVDRLQLAQFISLLLNNQSVRDVIDTATSKVVLILGRFKPERKAVLDAVRSYLQTQKTYVPIIFDFEKPSSLDLTETITLLARLARFIIADLTEPSSIPQELQAIVPEVAVPVQPIIEGQQPYSMFRDLSKYDWLLEVHRYSGVDDLLASLEQKVIASAEAMRGVLVQRKNQTRE